MVNGIREPALHDGIDLRGNPRDQETAGALDEPLGDLGDLRRCLPNPEDDLRQSFTQSPVVIDLGEAEVFVGQKAQGLYCLVNADPTVPDTGKQFL